MHFMHMVFSLFARSICAAFSITEYTDEIKYEDRKREKMGVTLYNGKEKEKRERVYK